MKKYLGLAVVIGTVGLALACTATVTSGGSGGDSGVVPDTDGGSSGTVDSGKKETGPKDAQALSCYLPDEAGSTVFGGEAKINQGRCTPAQVTAFTTALANKTLDAWIDATTGDAAAGEKDCRMCMGIALQGDPIPNPNDLAQGALMLTDTSIILNYASCQAAVYNQAGCNAASGKSLTDAALCLALTCPSGEEGCATQADEDACNTQSAAGACKAPIDAASACAAKLDADQASLDACLGAGSTTFDQALPILLTKVCGGAN